MSPASTPSIGYRIFVGAFPKGPAAEAIQAWRQRYDPVTARITQPHVTLWGTTWRTGTPTAANEAAAIKQLTHLCTGLSPFELTIGEVAIFKPHVVYLKAGPLPTLTTIRAALVHALGMDKHQQFTPHLTLAMRLNPEQTRIMLADMPASGVGTRVFTFAIEALCLMQRGPEDLAWRPIACANLGHTP